MGARRTGRLDHPLQSIDRRLGVFIVVYLNVPRHAVGSHKEPSEAGVDLRHADLPHADGRGVLRLPAAVGADVLTGARQVIVNLFGTVPFIGFRGPSAVDTRRLVVSDATAETLFRAARHRVFPWCFWAWWWCSPARLHDVGSNNPRGSTQKYQDTTAARLDGIRFHPY